MTQGNAAIKPLQCHFKIYSYTIKNFPPSKSFFSFRLSKVFKFNKSCILTSLWKPWFYKSSLTGRTRSLTFAQSLPHPRVAGVLWDTNPAQYNTQHCAHQISRSTQVIPPIHPKITAEHIHMQDMMDLPNSLKCLWYFKQHCLPDPLCISYFWAPKHSS